MGPVFTASSHSLRWDGPSHHADEETEAQKGPGSPTEPHGYEVAEGGLCCVSEALALLFSLGMV